MQSDQKFYPWKVVPPLTCEVGGYNCNIPFVPALEPTIVNAKNAGPFHGVELQASEMCPKNFIIFDQTDNKRRIMFHPAMASKFNYPGFDIHVTHANDNGGDNKDDNEKIDVPCTHENKDKESYSLKEDTKDIDALMSSDEEEDEDDEVSTGRTMGNCVSGSPDSCSSNCSKSHSYKSHNARSSSFQRSFSCSSKSTSGKRKQHRMREMIKALKRIVPGGDRMDTATVLDEAVRYLKTLKVEVKKLGIRSFKKS